MKYASRYASKTCQLENSALLPSRWGANPDETISKQSVHELIKRYGITVTALSCGEHPPSCSINMLKIDQQKDLLSGIEVMNFFNRMFRESWERLFEQRG